MAVILASLNVHGLRRRDKASRLLCDLKQHGVDVAALQETYFDWRAHGRVLMKDFLIFSAFGDAHARGVSVLVKRSLDARVNVVYAGASGRLVVVDVAVKNSEFRIVAAYAPNDIAGRRSFFRQLGSYLTDKRRRVILMGDWNAVLDPNLDRGGGKDSGRKSDSSLIDFVKENDLVDRWRVTHPGGRMWTWSHPGPSVQLQSYLDRMLVRRVEVDFFSCPKFHWLGYTDHKMLTIRMQLGDRPRSASYWKFNASLLDKKDFRDQLTGLIQRALVGAVTGNKWWGNLKALIRSFTVKYAQRLALDKATAEAALEQTLSQAVDGGGLPNHRTS